MADISKIQNGEAMTMREQIVLTAKLALPAILAQLSSIMMQYIDASMVGRLGADQSASVGLMSSSLLGCMFHDYHGLFGPGGP